MTQEGKQNSTEELMQNNPLVETNSCYYIKTKVSEDLKAQQTENVQSNGK